MRIALPFIFVLLVCAVIMLAYDPAPKIDDAPDLSLPVYSACQSNLDCALVARTCGDIAAVRKDRLPELTFYYDNARKLARCTGADAPAPQRAVCQSGQCAAVDTPASPQRSETP